MTTRPPQLILLDHPVLQHKLAYLLDATTVAPAFRDRLREVSFLLAYEATRDLEVRRTEVETPTGMASVDKIVADPVIVSIMRAGNGMIDAINSVIPYAKTGHIGIYRDKLIDSTVEYFFRMPGSINGKMILLADPIIATGDTAIACVNRLKSFGAARIRFLTVLTSKGGLECLFDAHPDVEVYALNASATLSEQGLLVPGLGDVGNRFYNST